VCRATPSGSASCARERGREWLQREGGKTGRERGSRGGGGEGMGKGGVGGGGAIMAHRPEGTEAIAKPLKG